MRFISWIKTLFKKKPCEHKNMFHDVNTEKKFSGWGGHVSTCLDCNTHFIDLETEINRNGWKN